MHSVCMYIYWLTAELEDAFIEVKGQEGFWELSEEEFYEYSCKMRVSMRP